MLLEGTGQRLRTKDWMSWQSRQFSEKGQGPCGEGTAEDTHDKPGAQDARGLDPTDPKHPTRQACWAKVRDLVGGQGPTIYGMNSLKTLPPQLLPGFRAETPPPAREAQPTPPQGVLPGETAGPAPTSPARRAQN